MKIHSLKILPELFYDVSSGMKTFEVRREDRGFAVGDQLKLREYLAARQCYTGRVVWKQVTYVLQGVRWGILPGRVVLGLGPVLAPVEHYHEDLGPVMWWRPPLDEPPWVGTPLDSDWPGHHTHFSALPPEPLLAVATDAVEVVADG